MRAEPPFMARSTSANVAMLVSPAVVIAKAPCATPQRTAHSTGLPARKPIEVAQMRFPRCAPQLSQSGPNRNPSGHGM
jgi:hypothetical protein